MKRINFLLALMLCACSAQAYKGITFTNGRISADRGFQGDGSLLTGTPTGRALPGAVDFSTLAAKTDAYLDTTAGDGTLSMSLGFPFFMLSGGDDSSWMTFGNEDGTPGSPLAVPAGWAIGGFAGKAYDGVTAITSTPSKSRVLAVTDEACSPSNCPQNIVIVTNGPNTSNNSARRTTAVFTSTGVVLGDLGDGSPSGAVGISPAAALDIRTRAGQFGIVVDSGIVAGGDIDSATNISAGGSLNGITVNTTDLNASGYLQANRLNTISSATASAFFGDGGHLTYHGATLYYCTGSSGGTMDGAVSVGNGNAGACSGGTWTAMNQ